jgi:hypothetical protein
MIVMVDSIESPETTNRPIPRPILEADAVGAYIAGNDWPTWGPYCRARPDLLASGRIVSITLSPIHVARCLDIERGGGGPRDAPPWFETYADRTHGLPWLYTQASWVAPVNRAMQAAGHSRDSYYVWSAHTGQGEHICGPDVCGYPAADGTQWKWGDGVWNVDVSLIPEYMLPAPGPRPREGDPMAIAVATRPDGKLEVFVETASGEILHTWQDAPAGGWHGAQTGKRTAAWETLGTPGRK